METKLERLTNLNSKFSSNLDAIQILKKKMLHNKLFTHWDAQLPSNAWQLYYPDSKNDSLWHFILFFFQLRRQTYDIFDVIHTPDAWNYIHVYYTCIKQENCCLPFSLLQAATLDQKMITEKMRYTCSKKSHQIRQRCCTCVSTLRMYMYMHRTNGHKAVC